MTVLITQRLEALTTDIILIQERHGVDQLMEILLMVILIMVVEEALTGVIRIMEVVEADIVGVGEIN